MKILFVSDVESKALWDHYLPERLADVDLIVSCGDLAASYLSFLATMAHCPVLYVPGNHDKTYGIRPPEGCVNIDRTIYTHHGIRILGLGGSMRYLGGPHQYTENQMKLRILAATPRIKRARGFDILVTHSPIRGIGDGEDLPHRGFACLQPLIERYRPAYHVHGHVHEGYGKEFMREASLGTTRIINACEKYYLEVDEEALEDRTRLAGNKCRWRDGSELKG